MEDDHSSGDAGIRYVSDGWLAVIKARMPTPIRSSLSRLRSVVLGVRETPPDATSLGEEPPWCSPDIWSVLCDAYARRPGPVVCEYGCGASTLHHLRNLLPLGGTYIGIESDPGWHSVVLAAVSEACRLNSWSLRIEGGGSTRDAGQSPKADTRMAIRGPKGDECRCEIRLRPGVASEGTVPAGCRDPWAPYVEALRERADLIIVDGHARKRCVNRVLEEGLLRTGGMLALLEAGRGRRHWLGRPTLIGEHDYRPEVERMVRLGGRLIDGRGLDSWPGLSRRRTPGREARRYPQEACLLVMADESRGRLADEKRD